MADYSKGKIYRIVGGDSIYIGSTTRNLRFRWAEHIYAYKKGGSRSVFELFNKYGVDNCRIELLEEYPCKTRQELHTREGEVMKECKCVNSLIPGRTLKEWYNDTIEIRKQQNKEWEERNKEKRAKRNRNPK
jgi:hypothetical protein